MKNLIKVLCIFSTLITISLLSGCTSSDDKETLSEPQQLSYDHDNQKISWAAVTNATSYELKINSEVKTVTTVYYTYEVKNDTSIQVTAKNTSGDFIESTSAEIKVVYMPNVTNISAKQGNIIWDKVIVEDQSVKYKVEVDGVEEKEILSTNEFTNTIANSGSTYRVKAYKERVGNTIYVSDYSVDFTATFLNSPEVKWDKDLLSISWDSVPGARGYTLWVKSPSGDVKEANQTTVSYTTTFPEVGIYELWVCANSSEHSVLQSKKSNVIKIERLGAPTAITNSSSDSNQNSLTLNFTNVDRATGYNITMNGIKHYSATNSFTTVIQNNLGNEQTFKFEIQSISTNEYVLDSTNTTSFEAKMLATVKNINVSNQTFTWDPVLGASGYTLIINGSRHDVEGTTYPIPSLEAGNHNIKIQTRGDGASIVSSAISNEFVFEKLQSPSNLKIVSSVLSWNAVGNCSSYTVTINSNTYSVNTNNFKIDSNMLPTATDITIFVVANGSAKTISSEASQTSNISKLNSVNPITTSTSLTWDNDPKATGYKIQYGNYDEITVTGTSIQWAALEKLGLVTVTVTTLGNGTTTFDSTESNPISIRILSPIIVSVNNETSQFEWTNDVFASGYSLTIDGEEFILGKQNFFKKEFTVAKTYEVQVKCLGDGIYTTDSAYGEKYSHEVKSLSAPNIANLSVTKDEFDFIFTYTGSQIVNSYGLILNASGVDYEFVNNKVTIQALSSSYNITIRAKGDSFSYIDSNHSSSRTITVLETIQSHKITPSINNVNFTFNPVAGAVNYEYTIIRKYSNGSDDWVQSKTDTSPEIVVTKDDDFLTEITIKVVVKGDNINKFDSASYVCTWRA